MKSLLAALVLLSSLSVWANEGTTQYYFERFDLVRDGDNVTEIRDKSLSFQFSIAPYLVYLKEILKYEQKMLSFSEEAYLAEVDELFKDEPRFQGDDGTRRLAIMKDSLMELKGVDVEQIFANEKFRQFVLDFEQKISDALAKIGLNVVAKTDDPAFFYKRNVIYQVVKFALDFAKRQFSTIPILNTASYIVTQVEKLVRERRLYHQNMLLHYFDRFKEQELDLTPDEMNHAFSSVYESRIPWFAFWESEAAKGNWDKYGTTRFFQSFRAGSARLRDFKSQYDSIGERYNFAFNQVTKDGQDMIINLVDTKHMFDSSPAVAHFNAEPQKVVRQRVVLQLAQLGLSFVTLPQFIKDFAGNFFRSFYENHTITEGALYGYFESMGNQEMKKQLLLQTVNPFEKEFNENFFEVYFR